jgi:hypothetical protein
LLINRNIDALIRKSREKNDLKRADAGVNSVFITLERSLGA